MVASLEDVVHFLWTNYSRQDALAEYVIFPRLYAYKKMIKSLTSIWREFCGFQEFQLSHRIFNSVWVSQTMYIVIFVQENPHVGLEREDTAHLATCRKRYKFLTGLEADLFTSTFSGCIDWICCMWFSSGWNCGPFETLWSRLLSVEELNE